MMWTPLFVLAPWCRDVVDRLACPKVGRVAACFLLSLGLWALPATSAQAADPLTVFELRRTDDGVHLDFATEFELSPAVEAALQKGVALNFVVEVQVFRERWYWRNPRVARAAKVWRLSYQPLTRQYRVGFGGLNQAFDELPEALAALQRSTHWKVADPADVATPGQYYLEFTYQLDTTLLPRPMQIGIGGQSDWALKIQKSQPLPPLGAATPE
jgi:hypothetical protein